MTTTTEAHPTATETCADCGQPVRYDHAADDYRHASPTDPDCFLIGER